MDGIGSSSSSSVVIAVGSLVPDVVVEMEDSYPIVSLTSNQSLCMS